MEGFWAQSKEQVLANFHVLSQKGLTSSEAKKRLVRLGYNSLGSGKKISRLEIFLRQFQSPLIYILVIASIFSLISGKPSDALIILAVVFFNSFIGFFQEYRAERTMSKLRQILAPKARVVRDGLEQKIDAKYLVTGDIVRIEAGDRVPADGRLLLATNLRVNQASLTGESVPSNKLVNQISAKASLIDQKNMVFSSTLVVSGQAEFVVTATGLKTELGKIATQVINLEDKPERLEQKINEFSQKLLIFISVVSAITLAIGLIRGIGLIEMIRVTISLLVSSVPEGLPVAITLALTLGLLRMYKKQVIVRKLAAAETLGSVTVICVDKTGTLTQGQMMVEKIFTGNNEFRVTGQGFGLNGNFFLNEERVDVARHPVLKTLLESASLSTMSTISKKDLLNDKARQLTDPTETSLSVVAAKANFYAFRLERDYPEILEIPFDQSTRVSASVHRIGRKNRYIVKGSPERILDLSKSYLTVNNETARLLPTTKHELSDKASLYASQGYRVVALGYVDYPITPEVNEKQITNLTLVGFFMIDDPIRSDVIRSIEIAKKAGVRVIMITGDHLLTGKSIGNQVGLLEDGLEAVHADEIKNRKLDNIGVIARATPEQKLVIVHRLQRSGEVVAMTGDGVNDAPALKKAEIGVAMGKNGTDVAIEAADMVLLQDSFSGIVAAIEQGRLIWENLHKVIFYLLSTAFAATSIILGSLFLGLPVALLPAQILWINLITGGVNTMALITEPAEKDMMTKSPPKPNAPLVSTTMLIRTVIVSLTMAIVSVLLYTHYLSYGVEYARTVIFLAVAGLQIVQVVNSRSDVTSIFSFSITRNPQLFISVAASVGLLSILMFVPFMSKALNLVAISWTSLAVIIVASFSVLIVEELRKLTIRSVLSLYKKGDN